jgi:hypothetical protein
VFSLPERGLTHLLPREIIQVMTSRGILLLAVAGTAAFAQIPEPRLKFEVASIRRAPDPHLAIDSGKIPHVGTKIDGARVDIGAAALLSLILDAFGLRPSQISGPDWLFSAGLDISRFDILARLSTAYSRS